MDKTNNSDESDKKQRLFEDISIKNEDTSSQEIKSAENIKKEKPDFDLSYNDKEQNIENVFVQKISESSIECKKEDGEDPLLLPSVSSAFSSSLDTRSNISNDFKSELQTNMSSSSVDSTTASTTADLSTHEEVSLISTFSACSSTITLTDASNQSTMSTSPVLDCGSVTSLHSHSSKTIVPLDMMPIIPLVPVQVPVGRSGVISVVSKSRGRPKSFGSQFLHVRHNSGGVARKGLKVKRISSGIVRGGRRLVHSMSLDDKGILGLRDDSSFNLDEDIQSYSQDDMFATPTVQEKWPGKTCSFCCLNELSQLGQGELNRYDATPGFNLPENAQFTEDVLREASASKRFKSCHGTFKDKGKSPRKQTIDTISESLDEMALVGHAERPNLAVLFTTNGQCFAHYMCAFWSHGVELTSDDTIACVDKAVVTASERKCFSCKKLGASVPCRVSSCSRWFHFPCAMTSGAVMDLKSVSMVCPSHVDKAKEHLVDIACMVCESSSSEESLLFCSSCGNHYHGQCLKPSLSVTAVLRTGWQCPDCKICQICRQPGDEILCVICDKAYHSICARPQGFKQSRIDWKCKVCRVCGDCGSRTPGNGLSSRWHLNFTVCDSCYQLRNKGLACPVCRKAYRASMQKNMAQCSICKRHVHSHCDEDADLNAIHSRWLTDRSYEYTCSVCRSNPNAKLQAGQFIVRSPEREDSQESIASEDSIDGELLMDDSVTSPVKPLGTTGNIRSLSSPTFSTSSTVSSSSTSTSLGLSFAGIHTSSYFERTSLSGSTNSSLTRGKPFGLARRGSILFPRMRGAVNKYNLGKKGNAASCRKRGTAHMPTARKGRGNTNVQSGRGYRGYFNYQQVTLQAADSVSGGGTGKEEGEENKIILINASDKYSTWQDACTMCGSFGQDQEGKLIACSQCGQCYHPYCANVKVSKVILEKGWRCLDCTVCEGCGERNDESRLVLCDDCDISCHIYCMTPPLDQVPAGIWKCKWCAICQYCGASDPGRNSMWQQNYSMCGPCFSMTKCPVCEEPYEDAELIIQCSSCERWLHASDDMIHTEDEAEKCIEKGYLCLLCRAPDSLPPHLLPPSPPPKISTCNKVPTSTGTVITSTNASVSISSNMISSVHSVTSPTRSDSPVDFMSKVNSNIQHWVDGTCLSDSGYHQIQNMTLQPVKKPRNLKGVRSRPSLDSTGSGDLDDEEEEEEDKLESISAPQHWVYGMKEGTLLNAKEHGDPPNLPEGYYTLPGPDHGTFILRKKRYRNIKNVGIGGFQVRARAKRDEEKAREEAEMDPQALELRRKRSKWRTKKKIRLLEKFPSYIQEAFFGRNLMDTSNLEEDRKQIEELEGNPPEENIKARKIGPSIRLSQDELELISAAKEKHEQSRQIKISPFTSSQDQQQSVSQTQPQTVQSKALQIKQTSVSGTSVTPKDNVNHNQHFPHQQHQSHQHISNQMQVSLPQQRQEEKKPKDEKVDDIVEDDENNDAIEALFGAGGSALIPDDLVRDIMNDEIKDEDATFTEAEDRDQIDGDSSVDGGKFTDLLPGFNLDDVADIMKNLREDTSEESSHTVETGVSGNASSTTTATTTTTTTTTTRVTVGARTILSSSSSLSHQSHLQSILPTAIPSCNKPSSGPPTASFSNSQRPNQPVMAPLGTTISGINNSREAMTGGVTIKPPNVSLQPSSIHNQPLPYHNQSPTLQTAFISETSQTSQPQQQQRQIVISRAEFNNHGSVIAPNVDLIHPSQSVPKQIGTVIAQPNTLQNMKTLPSLPSTHTNLVQSQKIPLPSQSPRTVMTPSSSQNSPVASVVVQHSPSAIPHGVISHTPQGIPVNTSPSPSLQQPAAVSGYPTQHFPGVTEATAPATPQLPSPMPSHEITKSWTSSSSSSSSSDSQSLSLTLEEDEALGSKATKAAVLYANIHNPSLRTDVPLIQDRERQIKRMWKSLDAEQRKQYAHKARENKKEYLKNKQEYQRALKSQEKEGGSNSSVVSHEMKQLSSQGTIRFSNPHGQLKSNISLLQRGSAVRYQSGITIAHTRHVTSSPSQNEGSSLENSSLHQSSHGISDSSSHSQNIRFHSPLNDGMLQASKLPDTLRSPDEVPPNRVITSDYSLPVGASYSHPPSTPRPHDDNGFISQHSQQSIQSQTVRQDSQQNSLRETIQHKQIQQGKWDDGNNLSASQNLSSATRVQGQFRHPLPPVGSGQQVRMRLPGHQTIITQSNSNVQHIDPRMRVVIQQRAQQEQQLQTQQSKQQQVIYHQHQVIQESQQQNQQISVEGFDSLSFAQQQTLQQQILSLRSQKQQQQQVIHQQQQQQSPQQMQQHSPQQVQQQMQLVSQSSLPPLHHSQQQLRQTPQQQSQQQSQSQIHSNQQHRQHPSQQQNNSPHHIEQEQQQENEKSQNMSELPESVTRELEQLEKEQKKMDKTTNPSDMEMENPDLSQMDDDLLSGIGDFKDLLEYAVSERDRITEVVDTRLPTNLFDNLDDEEHKDGQMKKDRNVDDRQRQSLYQGSVLNDDGASTLPSRVEHSSTMGCSPTLGPSPVQNRPSNQPSPILINQGPHSGSASAPATPGTPSHPGTQSPVSQTVGQMVPVGPSSGPIIGTVRMPNSSNVGVISPQGQIHGRSVVQIQSQIHPSQQGYTGGPLPRMVCQPAGSHLLRQHQSPSAHPPPPPPPPYPGHPPSYSRPQVPQVLTGDGLMVRAPLGSPLGGGPPVMRPQTLSPVMGNAPPILMGGPHRMPHPPHLGSQAHRRPLLLQEQRLLIEDIIEEEKREQMKQQKAVVVQQSIPEGNIVGSPSIIRPSYQRLASPVNSGQMYSSPGSNPSMARTVRPVDPGLHPALLQAGSRPSSSLSQANLAIKTFPPPPQPPDNPQTEVDFQMQQQYENWLNQQNNLITAQQKNYETEIAKLRRQKKSLNSRQRTLRKNGQELTETDAADLDRIQKETTIIQRQLESCRKSSRQHTMLISDYNNKKKQRQLQMLQSQSPTTVMSGTQQTLMSGTSPIGPPGSSPMHTTPQSPLMSHSPSSQHSMGMSPMVPSPHTPVASPNPAAIPQHSPHSMVVPVPHPSPDHHGGPFSPQTHMPSPGNTSSFSSQSVNHAIIGQGMRVRMPVLSPSNPNNQGNQMSSHMMVIRSNYSPGPVLSQQQSQQMVLKHQYSQNVIPLRRPSGSGPVLSPNSSSICHSPIGPVPSPASSIAIKPSPVQSGLKSPAPLSSPQMQSHITESPGTPHTPRSNEMMGNPPTPHSDHGGFASRVSSPHHSILTPTPPSPYVGCNSLISSNMNNDGSGIGSSSGNNNEGNPNNDFGNSLETVGNIGSNGGGGGLSGNIAPFPYICPISSRYGHLTFGLKGGSISRSRWGYFKFGLRGGQPSPVEESPVNINTSAVSASNSSTVQTAVTTTSVISHLTSDFQSNNSETKSQEDISSKNLKPVNLKVNFDTTEEGLAGVLSDCIRNSRISSSSSIIGISQPAYSSAISTTASIYSLPYSKVVVPEPSKSDIPPSSRHQAVIGIPGGGAIPSQSSIYPTPTIDAVPGVRIPRVVSTANYSLPNSFSSVEPSNSEVDHSKAIFVEGGGSLITHISSSTNTSSLIPAPIMSVKTTSSSLMTNVTKQPLISLAKDVNTLATVVSASNQVSLALSLGTSKSDIIKTNPISSILSSTSGLGTSVGSEPSSSVKYTSFPRKSAIGSLVPSSFGGSLGDHTPQQRIIASSGTSETLLSQIESNTTGENSGNVSSICVTKQSLVGQNTNIISTLGTTSSIAVTTRAQTHTLHHLPQQRLPVVLAAASQNSPTLQVVAQQGQIVSSNITGQSTRIIGTAIQPQPSNIVVQNQFGGHISSTHQMLQLPSITQLNTNQLTRTQVVQSLGQYGHVVQSSPSGQFFVQHQQPTGMVLASNGSHVRMVGQQVMMQPGVIRGSSVMVKSSAQVQGGVKMMMIHNSGQRTPTPPPLPSRQAPNMPPPAAKSPALHSASPISRVSPAPSPGTHSASPHSPQIKSHSPHLSSPVSSPQHSLTPTSSTSGTQLASNRKEKEEEKILLQKTLESDQSLQQNSNCSMIRTSRSDIGEGNVKEVQIPSAPNALLKQLLQNAGCSSSGAQGQLVFVRSTPGLSSQLSQVATQIPNPSNVTIPKSLSESSSQFLSVQPNQQSNSNAVLNPSTTPHTARSGIGSHQPTTVISSNVHSSENPSLTPVQMSSQAFSNLPPQTVIVSQTTSGGNVYTTQGQIQTVIPTTQYIRHVGSGQSLSSNSSRTSSLHTSSAVSGQYVLSQSNVGLSSSQGRSQQLCQSSSNTTSVQNTQLNNALQNSQRTSPILVQNASLTERIDSNPSLKTEMRVIIPDGGGSCSGPSTGGEHTPELNTPNDSCDDPEEVKKAKKRAQNQARRKSQSKDNKVQPAKRPRQGSRVEEDYESYIDGMMTQLRAMPPLSVLEPDVPRNFNVCPMYGCGDLSKLGRKDYNHKQGLLEGQEGSATVKNMNDHYNTQPFGPNKPLVSPAKKGPTQRGFYNQEFTPPKIGLPLEEYTNELDISLSNKPVSHSVRDSDSPDTVLSSSSPECVMPESPPSFKGLRLVDMDDDPLDDQRDRSISPAVPLLLPIPIKPFSTSVFDDKKFFEFKDNKENYPSNFTNISIKNKIGLTPALPLKDMGNVTVSLTLSSQAGQDVSHVLRSLANLLNIPPPVTYDIVDFTWDNNVKIRQMYKHYTGKEGKEQSVDMQSVLNGVAKFCKQCNYLIIQHIISKKLAEMPFLPKDEWEGIDDLSFCSKNCYIQFALTHRVVIDEKTGNPCGHLDALGRIRSTEEYLNRKDNMSLSDDFINDWSKDESLKEVLKVPHYEDERRGVKHKFEEEEEEEEEEEQYPKQEDGKRFRGHQYKYWTRDTHSLPDKYEKPTNKEMTDLLFGMRITYRMSRLPEDSRQCSLCPLYGDYVSDGPSRLLNYDVDKWVHLNCALWAEDVYETMSGSLVNVEIALKKASNLMCEHCEQPGASIKCFKVRCSKVYHLNCAVTEGCTFYKNKTVYCQEHINKGDKENELSTLAVFRRVYIDRDENRQIASVMHHTEMNHLLRIGSLILLNIGQLLPHQLQAFHSPVCIYPIGYHVIRFYWSMRHLHKRCAYECSIHEVEGEPEFRIVVKEEGYEDVSLASRSPKGVWNKVLEPIADLRLKNDVVKLFPQFLSGEDLFGLTEPAIVRILESMPGVDSLSDYTFKFGSNPLFELPLAVNPSGSARAEPFNKSHMKRHHGMRTSAGSVKTGGNLRTAATIASFTMNFDPFAKHSHSRFFQYKKMKNEWRSVVYLARSKIQGLGLYAARDIERNTAIIEYIGEIIRGELAEVREKRYEAQNRGVYMFRLDENRVVDATVSGGLARYINHSCSPNCYTETVEVEKDFKIIIVSNRKILRGEELAYDYKFDEEEDHKIPCLCGAENCRKWMN